MEKNTGFTNYDSVEDLPQLNARAAFTTDYSTVFREDNDLLPVTLDTGWQYMPWGEDNQMPYDIIDKVEGDETLSTCQQFNSEICYGAGLQYNTAGCTAPVAREVERFFLRNDFPSYYLGICEDLKYFGFAVSLIILNEQRDKVVKVVRKEACYCRFSPVDETGRIPYLIYANWRDEALPAVENMEKIKIITPGELFEITEFSDHGGLCPLKEHKYAVITRIPTPDSTYYPIPSYASIFRSRWYSVKQLIALAKESKLKNTAPIKYHIEVSGDYWEQICRQEGITDPAKRRKRVARAKKEILDFLTGAENSGKALFSTFTYNPGPGGGENHSVKITKIDASKEGGDWETDIQEAINMVCFTLRVHSNLVGSVPGKAQSNNSGSDKRELYTIAQALQKAYRDLIFSLHRVIIWFNGWHGAVPEVPFIQLTTLDQHQDAKEVIMK